MTTPLEYFRQFAREFDNVIDTEANAFIAAAELFIVVDRLSEERANAARALYAAHLAWIDRYQGNGKGSRGVVLSETNEKKQSRTYGIVEGSDTWLGQSPYGQQYLQLSPVGTGIITRFGC